MQTKSWIALFQKWLKDNQKRFTHDDIRVEVLRITSYVPRSIHVNLFAEKYEANVQLWETGESEFFFLDWVAAERDPAVGVVVTHHDFTTPAELYAALDALVSRMSPVLA